MTKLLALILALLLAGCVDDTDPTTFPGTWRFTYDAAPCFPGDRVEILEVLGFIEGFIEFRITERNGVPVESYGSGELADGGLIIYLDENPDDSLVLELVLMDPPAAAASWSGIDAVGTQCEIARTAALAEKLSD